MVQKGEPLGASYRFTERLGAGAVGEVWQVVTAAGERYAAKVLRGEHADDPELVERFVRERSVLIGLRDPHIVAVRDMVVEGHRLAIVMDLIEGGSLGDVIVADGPLRPADALLTTAGVLDALAAAHRAGVIHRDIKPDNVLLAAPWQPGTEPEVRVSDFGIASVIQERVRRSTGLIGTPQYMAPELISQGESGPAGDVYAAGIMLYQLLSGRTPFAGPGTDFTIAYRHVTSAVPELDVPADLWAALQDLLQKAPAPRPTAVEAAATLRRLASRLGDAPPLTRGTDPAGYDAVEHPATVVRGAAMTGTGERADVARANADEGEAPDLGAAGSATIARPLQRQRLDRPSPQREEAPDAAPPFWRTRKALVLAAVVVLLIAAMIVGFLLLTPRGDPAPDAAATALTSHQQAEVLPTGLTTSREARFDPSTGRIEVTLTYSAQKAPLSGDLLEVLPALGDAGGCPSVTWEGVSATRNQASVTGLDVECGWKLSGLEVPAGKSVEVTAGVAAAPTYQQALDDWLSRVDQATTAAVSDPDVKGTEYPVQRLRDVQVRTPSRVVSDSTVKVTLLPVWPGGADDLDPLYVSPSSGKPSQMLAAVAGGEDGVRFSDGCSGALAVDGSGLTVTALQIAPQCTVRATVGNFTDLDSDPFGVTSRDSGDS